MDEANKKFTAEKTAAAEQCENDKNAALDKAEKKFEVEKTTAVKDAVKKIIKTKDAEAEETKE